MASGPHVCILRAPSRPKANAGGSWPQWVGGLRQPGGRCGHLDHEGGLGVTGEGRGGISGGLPTLYTSGSFGQVNKHPPTTVSPPVKWVNQPLLGT